MNRFFLFRNWRVLLIQGILLVLLSFLVFNNPGVVLATLGLWLGIVVLAMGFYGIIAFFATAKDDRDLVSFFGSIAMGIIGIMMITRLIFSMMAISIAFGFISSIVGLALISGTWKVRQQFPLWWAIAILGLSILLIGIKSIFDVKAGAQNISSLIGITLLLSGLGLIWLSFLKRKVAKAIKEKWAH